MLATRMLPARLITRWKVLALSAFASACGSGGSSAAPGPVASITPMFTEMFFYVLADGAKDRLVAASFAAIPPTCSRATVAECVVSTCTQPTSSSNGPAIDPGTVSASSASLGGEQAIALTAGFGQIYQLGAFPAGEVVTLKATGGADIPAFQETVVIPADASGFTLDGCASQSLDAACPLSKAGATVAWTGGAGAKVVVEIGPSDVASYRYVSCTFDGAPGRGRIPAEVIARLDAAQGQTLRYSLVDGTARVHAGASHTVSVWATRLAGPNIQSTIE